MHEHAWIYFDAHGVPCPCFVARLGSLAPRQESISCAATAAIDGFALAIVGPQERLYARSLQKGVANIHDRTVSRPLTWALSPHYNKVAISPVSREVGVLVNSHILSAICVSACAPNASDVGLPARVLCLCEAYPEAITRVEVGVGDRTYVHIGDERFVWDDGQIDKSFDKLVNEPDLEDIFAMRYPHGAPSRPPARNNDPGRIRHTPFLKAVYGRTQAEVESSLVTVQWLGTRTGPTLRMNRRNGAAEALRRVSRDLAAELTDEELVYVYPSAGTFNWRLIAGTQRLSAHAFGIAIDLNVEMSDYWRWNLEKQGIDPNHSDENIRYENRLPFKIIAIFEHHGFIWGGKWYHYDTMHFEYRPEFFRPACRLSWSMTR